MNCSAEIAAAAMSGTSVPKAWDRTALSNPPSTTAPCVKVRRVEDTLAISRDGVSCALNPALLTPKHPKDSPKRTNEIPTMATWACGHSAAIGIRAKLMGMSVAPQNRVRSGPQRRPRRGARSAPRIPPTEDTDISSPKTTGSMPSTRSTKTVSAEA